MFIHLLYTDDESVKSNTKIELEGGKPVTAILFDPNGLEVFVSTTGPDVVQYNIDSGGLVRDYKGEIGDQITALAYSRCNNADIQRINQ